MRLTTGLIVLLALLGIAAAAEIGWRTDGTGRYPDARPPLTFSPTDAVVWSAPMPAWSNASPVVVGDRIFVCAEPDIFLAVDKDTGKILWQHATPLAKAANAKDQGGAKRPKTHPHNGFSSATPVSDGKHVFAVFGNGVVAAFDLEGKRLWTRFVEQPIHFWGHSASPVLVGGKLLIHFETLLALDPATGKELWRQPDETWVMRGKRQLKSWGTPIPTRIGETDVVLSAKGNIIDVADGKVLFPKVGNFMCACPIIADGIAYFVGGQGVSAVRLPTSLEGKPEELWKTQVVKNEFFYASPLLHEGIVYTLSQRGYFCAFDAKSGEALYAEKHLLAKTVKEKDAAYTSPTLAGGHIFFAGMDGSVLVVKPGRKYELVMRTKIEHSLRSNPVFEGKRMYLRAPGKLYCFGQ